MYSKGSFIYILHTDTYSVQLLNESINDVKIFAVVWDYVSAFFSLVIDLSY